MASRAFAHLALAAALALASVLAPARAQAVCDLEEGRRGTVAAVLDGDTLRLDDGQIVRLVAIRAPRPARGNDPGNRSNARTALAQRARAALEALVEGHAVRLFYGGRRTDRYGRLLAHVFVADGAGGRVWAQGALVDRGLARVASFADNRACLRDLIAREARARADARGLWAAPAYAVREAGDVRALWRLAGTFQLVEGRVLETGASARRLYLNFGPDWRRDFTVSVERDDAPAFRAAGIDLTGLKGARVRVRGWIELVNGPLIDATHPEQLEILKR